jgi:hypothetical protein
MPSALAVLENYYGSGVLLDALLLLPFDGQ